MKYCHRMPDAVYLRKHSSCCFKLTHPPIQSPTLKQLLHIWQQSIPLNHTSFYGCNPLTWNRWNKAPWNLQRLDQTLTTQTKIHAPFKSHCFITWQNECNGAQHSSLLPTLLETSTISWNSHLTHTQEITFLQHHSIIQRQTIQQTPMYWTLKLTQTYQSIDWTSCHQDTQSSTHSWREQSLQ